MIGPHRLGQVARAHQGKEITPVRGSFCPAPAPFESTASADIHLADRHLGRHLCESAARRLDRRRRERAPLRFLGPVEQALALAACTVGGASVANALLAIRKRTSTDCCRKAVHSVQVRASERSATVNRVRRTRARHAGGGHDPGAEHHCVRRSSGSVGQGVPADARCVRPVRHCPGRSDPRPIHLWAKGRFGAR